MEEKWYNSPNANPNLPLSYYKVGSSRIVPASKPTQGSLI
jgi:hypothetical protein